MIDKEDEVPIMLEIASIVQGVDDNHSNKAAAADVGEPRVLAASTTMWESAVSRFVIGSSEQVVEVMQFALDIYHANVKQLQLCGNKNKVLGLRNLRRFTGMLISQAIVLCRTQVQDCSNAVTQHSNSGAAAPAFISIDMTTMTEVLSLQAGDANDGSTMNHQAHAHQVADNDDGPPPTTRIDIGNPADESANLSQMAKLLLGMGLGTLTMSVGTALYKAPRGVLFERYKPAYYGTLAVISVCGMAEVAVAFCVSRCRRFVRVVLCASLGPFATVVALGGFSVVMKG